MKEGYAEQMEYRRLGRSGLRLSALSLGFWQNFGAEASKENARSIVATALDGGITSFDLANNYGPPLGAAEEMFGYLYRSMLRPLRDEIVVATKAGYPAWSGPYGDGGSRKYLIASCDRSLRAMGLDYVDIFYSHRYDPATPLEETMGALDYIVRSGRALYVALSKYPADVLPRAMEILRSLGTPCIAHQVQYSMLARQNESLFPLHKELGVGCVTFSPLAQGQLTNRYAEGIPADSRAGRDESLKRGVVEDNLPKVKALADVAAERGESLAQLALAWQLQSGNVDSVIIGASRAEQVTDNLKAIRAAKITDEEYRVIDGILDI